MPNCFSLYKKGSSEPEILQNVDVAICNHLGVPVHEKYWCHDWYNIIGLLIACGKPLGSQELRDKVYEIYGDSNFLLEIGDMLSFLEENYTSNAWAEIGKR